MEYNIFQKMKLVLITLSKNNYNVLQYSANYTTHYWIILFYSIIIYYFYIIYSVLHSFILSHMLLFV